MSHRADAVVHQAMYDASTDIFNRRALLEPLKKELIGCNAKRDC
jgi:GGDEF domain-containing protein